MSWYDELYAGSGHAYDTTKFIADDLWHHLAVIREQEQITFYSDNQQVGSFTTGLDPVRDDHLDIGRSLWSGALYFDGLIDDVRIYDRALTAGQVEGLFEAASRDSDGDGIPDESELAAGTDPTNPDMIESNEPNACNGWNSTSSSNWEATPPSRKPSTPSNSNSTTPAPGPASVPSKSRLSSSAKPIRRNEPSSSINTKLWPTS